MAHRLVLRAAALAALVLGAAACGTGGGGGAASYTEPSGASMQTATIKAGNIFFDPKSVTVPAGVVTIELVDTQPGPHTLVIEGVNGFELQVSTQGQKDALKVDLQPGAHKFWCTIPGHRAAGMEGTITVS